MEKKTIYYILGGVAVLGIGYYLWSNSQKKAKETEVTEETEVAKESTTEEIKEVKPQIKDLAGKIQNINLGTIKPLNTETSIKAPLTTKKEKKKACGRKPILKNKKAEWQKCVDEGGVASFEGVSEMYDQNMIREKSFAEQVINREDGRMFAGSVYDN